MTEKKPPIRWQRSDEAIRAVQVAFDVGDEVMSAVRHAAFSSGLSTSDQVRVVLGLSVIRQPKRPRLTVSLGPDDYAILAQRYGLAADDRLAIKERVLADLIRFGETGTAPAPASRAPEKMRETAIPVVPPPSPRRKTSRK